METSGEAVSSFVPLLRHQRQHFRPTTDQANSQVNSQTRDPRKPGKVSWTSDWSTSFSSVPECYAHKDLLLPTSVDCTTTALVDSSFIFDISLAEIAQKAEPGNVNREGNQH